jgi:para-aminobenzoate synthetase
VRQAALAVSQGGRTVLDVLVVDNHDSFTWNLVDLLESCPDTRCHVIANDQAGWTTAQLARADAVVISPGPGHPANPRDFGHCAAVIRFVEEMAIPTLGVCLGHQGICAAHGADVVTYPEPHHGRRSDIEHDGTSPLFHGIPRPFGAVRYHSLTATGVASPLRVTAWCADLVMAVEHESLPIYGVQFHPESAGSDVGRQILHNFLALARARKAQGQPWRRQRATRIESATVDFCGDLTLLQERFAADAPSYLLESAAPRRGEPMWSHVGVCGPHWMQAVAGASGFRLESAHDTRELPGVLLDWVEDHVTSWSAGGARGTIRWAIAIPYESTDPTCPARALYCDRTMDYDHATCRLTVQAVCDDDTAVDARQWIDDVIRFCALAERAMNETVIPLGSYRLVLRDREHEYLRKVTEAQEHIRRGESYELCLTSRIEVVGERRPFDLYRALREASPSYFAAHLRFGDCAVISSSPERFLRLDGGRCLTEPIKGTRPRGRTPHADLAHREALANSEKDHAENLMIVDLARNDLRRVSQPNTVNVDRMCDLETHPTVFQLTSSVSSVLLEGTRLSEVIGATFPPGSMTGAPKVRSVEILSNLEDGNPRGYYSGAIGHLCSDGRMDLSVVIRAIVDDGTTMSYGVGGAVTALSDPREEFREVLAKTAALGKALGCRLPN